MSLSQGRSYLAIPGPSVMPDAVLQAMHVAAPNIYTDDLPDVVRSMVTDLQVIAQTDAKVAMYIGNGHAAWEAAIANVLNAGDQVLVLATGRFGESWADMAVACGCEVEVMNFGKRSTIDPDQLAARLAQDTDHRIKAVLAVHVDTATSIKNDIGAVRAVMDTAGHPALLMADCIASFACDDFQMDAWGVDIMVTACQKGLMTPPGVALVFYNEKAAGVKATMPRISNYWNWTPRAEGTELWQMFCGTAPTHHLYGMRKALDMIMEEGVAHLFERHARLAAAVWAALEHWGQSGPLEMNVQDPSLRSNAVTGVRIGAPLGTQLRTWMEEEAGITLGIGLGMADFDDPAWHGFFRIGHMGHVNAHMVLGVLASMEAGMTALGIEYTPGGVSKAAASLAAGSKSCGSGDVQSCC